MPHLTVPDQTPRLVYPVTGSTTGPFVVSFPITNAEDLVVKVGGVQLTSSQFTFTSTNTVTGGYQTGTVTLATAVASTTVDISRAIPIRRNDDFQQAPLDMDALNTALDRLTAQLQDLRLLASLTPTSTTVSAAWQAIVQAASVDAGLALAGDRFSFRNRLLNSAFNINQRGLTSVGDGAYFFDRWYILTETGNVTVTPLTDPETGRPTGVRLTQPDATPKRIGIAQAVETTNIRDLRSAAAAMAARVRCSVSQPIRMAILEHTGTADAIARDVVNSWSSATFTPGNFFIASSLNVVAIGVSTPAANVWTDLPGITGAFGSGMNNAIVMVWTEGTLAQNATLDFDQAQLEAGSVCGAFTRRAFGNELALCQRYYQKSYAYATAPGAATATGVTVVPLNGNASTLYSSATVSLVPKRATPTVTAYDNAGNASRVTDFTGGGLGQTDNRITIQNITASTDSFRLINTQSGTTFSTFHWTADAEL